MSIIFNLIKYIYSVTAGGGYLSHAEALIQAFCFNIMMKAAIKVRLTASEQVDA